MMQNKNLLGLAAGLVLAAVILYFGVTYPIAQLPPAETPQALGTTNFDTMALSGDLTVGGDAAITGDATVTGAGTVSGDFTVDDTFNVDDTSYALTGTQTLTPTASMYLLSNTAALTLTLGDGTAGDFLWFYSSTTNSVVISDTNIRTTTGSALTLGQYDITEFWFNGTDWIELLLAADS